MMTTPNVFPTKVLLFSGKRKSGKDFLTEKLHAKLGEKNSVIIRISAPIKSHWAKKQGLDYNELLGSGTLKETQRKEMIDWSESVRASDPSYFCKVTTDEHADSQVPIWIVSDIRRKTDVEFFKTTYGEKVKMIRIVSDEDIRKSRGWVFTPGVDDQSSECGLDDIQHWDLVLTNNGTEESDKIVENIISSLLLVPP